VREGAGAGGAMDTYPFYHQGRIVVPWSAALRERERGTAALRERERGTAALRERERGTAALRERERGSPRGARDMCSRRRSEDKHPIEVGWRGGGRSNTALEGAREGPDLLFAVDRQ
jgi:hypothetical protein